MNCELSSDVSPFQMHSASFFRLSRFSSYLSYSLNSLSITVAISLLRNCARSVTANPLLFRICSECISNSAHMNTTWVLLVSSLGFIFFFFITVVHIHSPSLSLSLFLHTACKVRNKASNFRCNTRIWNSSNLRQPGNHSFADGKLSEGNGKMNHKRCGIGVKATRLRQNFSVTNPGPASVFSSYLTSKILRLNFRFLKMEKQC